MEDDVRMETNETGFCSDHIQKMYGYQKRTNDRIETLLKSQTSPKKGLFGKKETDPLTEYLETLENSCYVCNRMHRIFDRYLDTVLYCYDKDSDFRAVFQQVTDDLEWFTDKFDYRNENAPWKNSKDALPRSIIKTNHTIIAE